MGSNASKITIPVKYYFGGRAVDCRDFDPQLCIVQLTDFHFGESSRQSLVDTVFNNDQKAKAKYLKFAQVWLAMVWFCV